MQKRFINYLLIASINLIVLTTLLALWTDKLELLFNELVRPIEFSKIVGTTVLAIIGMKILDSYLEKKNKYPTNTSIKFAILLTILLSAYLYIDYTAKLVSHTIVNRQFRSELANKITTSRGLAYVTKAEKLTFAQYMEISKINNFPKLPIQATNIMYKHSYDGFLPDYSFTLAYDLPVEIKVDTINYEKNSYSKKQTYEIVGSIKRVTYYEEIH